MHLVVNRPFGRRGFRRFEVRHLDIHFFITFVETPHLNGNHTIFGEVIEGEDIVNSITFVQPGNLANQEPAGDEIFRIDIYES